jgi:phosphopantetheine--protein transferase-like protein
LLHLPVGVVMDHNGQLREVVAAMLMVSPDQLAPDTSLASLHTSLGDARLRLALKRCGLALPPSSRPGTLRELEAVLAGKAPAAANGGEISTTVTRAAVASTGIQVGIDVQEIRSLPVADDYWEHEFYVGMFDKSEIAYAVAHSEPRIHLAGYWCAKEALRKCDPSFLKIDFASTLVAHEQDGRPYLMRRTASGAERLSHAVSVSHAGELATAVVVAAAFPPLPITAQERAPEPVAPRSAQSSASDKPLRWPGMIFGSVALLVVGAIIAILSLHYLRP